MFNHGLMGLCVYTKLAIVAEFVCVCACMCACVCMCVSACVCVHMCESRFKCLCVYSIAGMEAGRPSLHIPILHSGALLNYQHFEGHTPSTHGRYISLWSFKNLIF